MPNKGAVMKTLLTLSALFLLSTASAASGQAARPNGNPPAAPVGTAGTSGKDAAAPVAADYRLVPGDKLRVEVYKDPQLSQSLQVRPDGKITLPLVNDIPAAGRTPTELREAIATSLKTYITNPTVTVIVVETVPPVVYVMGEVNTPGPHPFNGQLSVLQALSMAGGFRDFANRKNILIRRGNQVIKFNYNDAIKANTQPLMLRAGDTIVVP
jgi:polysaccharide biosynthesis/export protein